MVVVIFLGRAPLLFFVPGPSCAQVLASSGTRNVMLLVLFQDGGQHQRTAVPPEMASDMFGRQLDRFLVFVGVLCKQPTI